MEIKDLQNRFKYYEMSKDDSLNMRNIIMNFLNLAMLIDELVEDSREKSLAITRLEESMNWVELAIKRKNKG